MRNGLRSVAAVVTGFIAASLVMMLVEFTNGRIFHPDLAPPDAPSAYERTYRVAFQNGRSVLAGDVAVPANASSVGVARLLNADVFADGFEAPLAPGEVPPGRSAAVSPPQGATLDQRARWPASKSSPKMRLICTRASQARLFEGLEEL